MRLADASVNACCGVVGKCTDVVNADQNCYVLPQLSINHIHSPQALSSHSTADAKTRRFPVVKGIIINTCLGHHYHTSAHSKAACQLMSVT
jgi:hypothetical protein